MNKAIALTIAGLLTIPAAVQGQQATVMPVITLEDIVVSASRVEEPLRQVASTVQVISEEAIRRSTARSVTELLAENAVGFFSEWTPAQTSINIRGGASDGQGRDFRGQVLVLFNGRRAGTANLSKLSLADVERIEIVRGPASVSYGSQAIGGVVNIITRSGRNTQGNFVSLSGGSWGLVKGNAYTAAERGNIDYYLGVHGGRRDSYDSGEDSVEEPLANTDWQRYGGLGTLGYAFNDNHRIDLTLRFDGVFDAGFRGSSWDLDNEDDRYNQSLDLIYTGNTADYHLTWTGHFYAVRDEDDFNWGSEVAGVDIDNNERTLDIYGLRLSSGAVLAPSNDLLGGVDLEYSELRSERFRQAVAGGAPVSQSAPFDNNQDEKVVGVFLEDVQRLFDDRITLRAGARYTYGETSIVSTPNQPALRERTEDYDQLTYSLGGTVLAADWLKLRAGYATGFRAPTATELAADFTLVLGGQVIGNPNIDPETSQQIEFGVSTFHPWLSTDVAVFQNTIEDRIITRNIDGGRRQFINNPGDIVVRGVDLQANLDLARVLGLQGAWRTFATATYHFDMEDEGVSPAANTDKPERIYQYQAVLGTVFGKPGRWDLGVTGILRGPFYWDTEERLLIPEAEPRRDFIHRKDPFWVWNVHGSYRLLKGITAFASVNNVLDENEHPIFFALNKEPLLSDPAFSNGGRGNSMPGREFLVGIKAEF